MISLQVRLNNITKPQTHTHKGRENEVLNWYSKLKFTGLTAFGFENEHGI